MDYNHHRPHSSLDYMAPAVFASKSYEQGSDSLRLTQGRQSECDTLIKTCTKTGEDHMSHSKKIRLSIALLMILIPICYADDPEPEPIYIPDPYLAEAISDEVAWGHVVDTENILDLISIGFPTWEYWPPPFDYYVMEFHASCDGTTDLTGIEYAINLEKLSLAGSHVTYLSPLTDLTKMTDLSLGGNGVSDIGPLANLVNMEWLDLSGNSISSITSLAHLTDLTMLHLEYNAISDISPLSALTRLTYLKLWGNDIADISALANMTSLNELYLDLNSGETSDLSPLANLTELTLLYLTYSSVSDISPLADLTNMDELWLSGNHISDISPMANLTSLTELWIGNNTISDISPLANLTRLTYLEIYNNLISDISPLSYLTNMDDLSLSGNNISDISPLANLTNLTYLDLTENPLDIEAYQKWIPLIKANNPGIDFEYDPYVEKIRISSKYCEPFKKTTYFITGVSLLQEFTVEIKCLECEEGIIEWHTKDGIVQQNYFDTQQGKDIKFKSMFDMGEFAPGDFIEVSVLTTIDGKDQYLTDKPIRANFEIVPVPDLLDLGVIGPVAQSLSFVEGKAKYKSVKFALGFQEIGKKAPPIFDGNNTLAKLASYKWQEIFTVEGKIDLNGHCEIKYAGPKKEFKKGSGMLKTITKMADAKLEGAVAVVLTCDYHKGSWVRGGGFDLSCVAKNETKPAYAVFMVGPVPIPVYYKFMVEAGIGAHCRFTDGTADKPIFTGKVPVKGGLGATAGVGISGIACVEGYLKGELGFLFEVYPQPQLEKWDLTLSGGIKIVVIFYSFENNFLLFKYPGTESTAPLSGQALTSSRMKPLDRNYLEQDYAVWVAGGLASAASALQSTESDGENILQSNVFSQSDPQLASSHGHKCLVWLHDEPTRNSLDRTILVYSTNSGSGWSTPKAIYDDGTADTMPSLAVTADGEFLCVWSNASQLIPDGTDLAELADTLDIKMAVYDNSSDIWTSETVTNATALDYNPAVSCSASGDITVVWTHDEDNDLLSENQTVSNILMARTKTASGWQPPKTLAAANGLIKYVDIEHDSTGGHVVYCLDTDSNFGTDTDNELFYTSNTSGAWSTVQQLTNDPNSDVNPQFVKTSTDLMLVWAKDGRIVSTTDVTGMTDLNGIVFEEGSSGQRSFVTAISADDSISVIWNDPSEAGSDIYTSTYDSAMAAWSPSVQLTNNSYMERSISAAYSEEDTLEIAYNKVHFDSSADGLNAFGQVDLCTYQHKICADISVVSDSISIDDPNAVPGDTVDLQFELSNLGDIAVSDIPVAFYCGQAAEPNNQIGVTQIMDGVLLAGEKAVASVAWNIPQSNKALNVIAVVDPELQIEDGNRQNNSATVEMFGANISIDSAVATRTGKNTHTITANIVNSGFVNLLQTFTVSITNYDESKILDSRTVLGLGTDEGKTVELTVDADQIDYGFNQFKILVDPGNAASDMSESDNTKYIMIENINDCDFVPDGTIDMLDLGVLSQQWLDNSHGLTADIAPYGGDGLVDFTDFSEVTKNWMHTIASPVPDLSHVNQVSAANAITEAGFVVGIISQYGSETVEAGKILSQYPSPGTLFLQGSAVDVIISYGLPITVTHVAGMLPSEAEAAITCAGLVVGTVSQQYSNKVEIGKVSSQNPIAGTFLPLGGGVDITISIGPWTDEDFESGNINPIQWQHDGDADWEVVSDSVYKGGYAAKSGAISHDQISSLELTANVDGAYAISFARKVSSEEDYDFLEFYIDGNLQERFSGELDWEEFAYPIGKGEHTFRWTYSKDGSFSEGSDCCSIDAVQMHSAE